MDKHNVQHSYGFQLHQLVEGVKKELLELSEPSVSRRPSPEKWCAKEILGHLIDSAMNNHQRFIRAVNSGGLEFPGYDQDHWVRVHRYYDAIWLELIQLWTSLNRFIAHTLQEISIDDLFTKCWIGDGEPVSLEFLIGDYIRHIRHHLGQIREVCRL